MASFVTVVYSRCLQILYVGHQASTINRDQTCK